MSVLLNAFDIFLERNGSRKDLWADFDLADSLHHIKSKAARLERSYKDIAHLDLSDQRLLITDKDVDEAYDLINYCAFFIRNVLGWVS